MTLDGGFTGVGPDGGPEETCDRLIGSHGAGATDLPVPGRLRPGADYFQVAAIPAGTLGDGSTYLLSLTGCLPGAEPGAGAVACGAGYDGGSSAQIGIAQLDTTTPAPAAGIGAQFAHRSSALQVASAFDGSVEVHGPASRGVIPVLLVPSSDAGPGSVVTLEGTGAPVLFSATALAPATSGSYAVDPLQPGVSFGAILLPADGGAPVFKPYPDGDLLAMPLTVIEALSRWDRTSTGAPAAFTAGQSYTFVLVGDPAQPSLAIANPDGGAGEVLDPSYDGRGLHFVAFPNWFTPTQLLKDPRSLAHLRPLQRLHGQRHARRVGRLPHSHRRGGRPARGRPAHA